MNVLKNISVAILCFLLFLSLLIFGVAYTVNQTLLNPDFVAGEINRLELSKLVEEMVDIESPPEMPELEEVVYNTIESLEPVLKERMDDTIHAIFEYFPDNTHNLELNEILRENFLTAELISSLVDNLDISELAGLFITRQFTEQIPIEIENFDKYLTDAIEAAEPEIKAQLVAAADPVFDYILGMKQTLLVTISIDEIKDSLSASVRQSLLESPPPELASVPVEMREQLFDDFYDDIVDSLPSSFVIDNSIIGKDVPVSFNEALTDAEDAIEEAGIYVGYFKTAYTVLIILMAVLVLAIILILRDVRKITRRLGVPLITYGLIEYAGVWIARIIARGGIPVPEIMPEHIQEWIFQFVNNLFKPLEIFSLVLLGTGIILVIISYVYKRGDKSEAPVP